MSNANRNKMIQSFALSAMQALLPEIHKQQEPNWKEDLACVCFDLAEVMVQQHERRIFLDDMRDHRIQNGYFPLDKAPLDGTVIYAHIGWDINDSDYDTDFRILHVDDEWFHEWPKRPARNIREWKLIESTNQ